LIKKSYVVGAHGSYDNHVLVYTGVRFVVCATVEIVLKLAVEEAANVYAAV
jgi:hypothetical protein